MPKLDSSERPEPNRAHRGTAVLRLAFRPFYLLAALQAVVVMCAWLATLSGRFEMRGVLPPTLWHAHEMLFGVITAAIIGFTLTAAKTWTGLQTPMGAYLGLLVCLWSAARIAAFSGSLPLYSAFDVLTLPLASLTLLHVLWRANSRRNFVLASVLILLSCTNMAFHGAALGFVPVSPLRVLYTAVSLIVILETIVAGRVIPAFTASANPTMSRESRTGSDLAVVVMTALGLGLWVLDTRWYVSAPVLGCAAMLHAIRWNSWGWRFSLNKPILLILHVSYAWIPLGLGLLSASQAGLIAQSPAIHALTAGSMGGLVIGMMTRTARGHTGRAIRASTCEQISYASIVLSAAVRVFGPLLFPPHYWASILISGSLWIIAFALFLVVFTPWLVSKRIDGLAG